MPQPINEKSFILLVKSTGSLVRSTKTYSLLVKGFTITALWFVNIVQSLVIVTITKLKSSASATISLDPLSIVIDTVQLASKITTIISNSIVLNAVASLIYKISASISNSIVFDYTIRLIGKISSILNTTNVIVYTMITAVFNSLGDFDGDTLGTMDVITLGDLDYTAV